MSLTRLVSLVLVCIFLTASSVLADDPLNAHWSPGEIGDWTATNWLGIGDSTLPAPGYPTSDYTVDICAGFVSIVSQDVSVVALWVADESVLTVANGKTLTVVNGANFHPGSRSVGHVFIPDGHVNLRNTRVLEVHGLSFDIGTNSTAGYLDLGSEWGSTNAIAESFGILNGVRINLANGGLRVDASNITMRSGTAIRNSGQEMTFRGDWLNPDGTTTFFVDGNGPGTIDIAGNFSFGGCALNAMVDTDGVSLIRVGGDAMLSNATLTVGCSDALTGTAASYDLIRVPAGKTIYTNGMICCVASNGGFLYTAAIDEDRDGYDYLVITPGRFLPGVTLTNPANESFFSAVTDIPLGVTTFARSGFITNIAFYADTNKIGEVADAPYSFIWTNVYAGYYELKAVAADDDGNRGESPVVGINVQGAGADGRKVFITGGAVIRYDPGCAQ